MSKTQMAKESELVSELMEITPKLALDWLSAIPEYQRKHDEKHSNVLAIAIQKNEWKLNGESIKFNLRGDLIDGQHRLHAIVKSGRSVQSLVVTGISKDDMTFATLGDVKSRKVADFIHTTNRNIVAGVLRLVWFHEQNLLMTGLRHGNYDKNFPSSPPVAEIVRIAKRHAEPIELLVQPLEEAIRVSKVGTWCVFLMYYFQQYRPETEVRKVVEFFARLADGAELKTMSPILRLRRRLLETKQMGLARLPRIVIMAMVLKALNSHLIGEEVERITWNPDREDFPKLRGYDTERTKKK